MLSWIVVGLAVLALLAYLLGKKKTVSVPVKEEVVVAAPPPRKQSISYGTLNIFFASQTGTAAKLADQFAKEAEEQGFVPSVIDLKDFQQEHFTERNICVFLLSNTGEGDPPDNSVEFIKSLKGKADREIDYSRVRFTVFGLGNTQYQFYNKTAKVVDELLEKLKATRVYKLGLGDNNASLEDDYVEWRNDLWPQIKKISQEVLVDQPSPVIHSEERLPTEADAPNLASWRFVKTDKKAFNLNEEFTGEYDLEFLTRGYLRSQPALIRSINEVRQNNSDGSSILIEIEPLKDQKYKTAGNLAVYPENDPEIVEKVAKHFNLDMDAIFDVQFDKKCKLPFCTPVTMRTLLTSCIDLQHPVSKSLLKNLGKLPSRDPKYFQDNSSPKTTKEYSRLTSTMHYLFKFIEHYQVQMNFETFVKLSDPIAPRLFTIASSAVKYPHSIFIVDSLEDEGLCSKYFKTKPKEVRVEIKDSSFDDAMLNEKIVLVSAGTGFAPFKGYLEEKELLQQQGKPVPMVSLFFGCRHEEGDFIFKDQIKQWVNNGVINKFYPAFSRDSVINRLIQERKIYVQDLLLENRQEVLQLLASDRTKMYACGSLPMGNSINEVIATIIEEADKVDKSAAKERVTELQRSSRIIKELW